MHNTFRKPHPFYRYQNSALSYPEFTNRLVFYMEIFSRVGGGGGGEQGGDMGHGLVWLKWGLLQGSQLISQSIQLIFIPWSYCLS